MKLDGKLILITGASTGIGKAVTEELAKHNCKIVIIARNSVKLKKLEESAPDKISSFTCDITDIEQVTEVYSKIKTTIGIPDIVILNAGISNKSTIDSFNSDQIIKTINTNFTANIFWLEQLLPDFIQRKSGFIAGVSSMADNRAYSLSGGYSAAKSALTNYLEGISIEAKKYNIKICTIRPGFVKSPMTDKNNFRMPFMMKADKAAKIIIKGIMKEKRYIQFPVSMVIITKLIGFLPDKLFERLFYKITKQNS